MTRQAHLARDTAVRPVGFGRFAGTVTDGWLIAPGGAANGGYLMTMAARAMQAVVPQPDPVTVTAHFLRPAPLGEVLIATEVVRTGRRHSTVQAAVTDPGGTEEYVRLLGAFGDLASAEGPTRVDRHPPDLPPIEECVDTWEAERRLREQNPERRQPPPMFDRLDLRFPADVAGWAIGQPLGRGEMKSYSRLAGDESMDSFGLLMLADALPPAVFNTGEMRGWVPTVELTVQIRKRPAPGWLRTVFRTEALTRGYLEEDGEIWDEDGDLVALSRQLALAARSRRGG